MVNKLPTQTYHQISRDKVDTDFYRNKLKLKRLEAERKLSNRYPDFSAALKQQKIDLAKLREYSSKLIYSGVLAGTLMLLNPQEKKIAPLSLLVENLKEGEKASQSNLKEILVSNLKAILPERPRSLLPAEEEVLESLFRQVFNLKAKANLDGQHLNTTYGLIGKEQHLRRYPSDSLREHGEDKLILEEGMAPGLGAWGYFAPSREKLTDELKEIEKWYAVVQTLYLQDWETNQPFLKNWYKYRKVLIVNTKNGRAVVASIADSGPAAWTGKHFGGSPEVMEYLGGASYTKGPVVLFFIDDPEGKVPLGPVKYGEVDLSRDNLNKS